MQAIATITSKRQLTIPVSIFRKANLGEKRRVLVEEKDGIIQIQPLTARVEKLAGTLKIPKKFRGLTLEQIIKAAKKEYFSR